MVYVCRSGKFQVKIGFSRLKCLIVDWVQVFRSSRPYSAGKDRVIFIKYAEHHAEKLWLLRIPYNFHLALRSYYRIFSLASGVSIALPKFIRGQSPWITIIILIDKNLSWYGLTALIFHKNCPKYFETKYFKPKYRLQITFYKFARELVLKNVLRRKSQQGWKNRLLKTQDINVIFKFSRQSVKFRKEALRISVVDMLTTSCFLWK